MSDISEFLRWTDAIETGHAVMDDTHREFIALLDAAGAADDARMLERLDALIAHTREHFAQETTWMQLSAFPPIDCHEREHAAVLETAIEVRRRVAAGDPALGRKLVVAVAQWFQAHAQSMDKVLALWLAQQARDGVAATGVAACAHAAHGHDAHGHDAHGCGHAHDAAHAQGCSHHPASGANG